MPEQVTITIPDGYERITTVEDMPKCTHVLLADETLLTVTQKSDGKAYIYIEGIGRAPYHDNALKQFICLKKREPKRDEFEAEISDTKTIKVRDNSLQILLSPFADSKVKVTVEEVIQ